MNKVLMMFVAGVYMSLPVFATCPLDSVECSVAAFDQSVIRAPFKPIYSEYGSGVDFGEDPVIRLNPVERVELDRNFHMKNEMKMNQDSYNSDCQFGVCLPNRIKFN